MKAAYGNALQVERDVDNYPVMVTATTDRPPYEVYWADVLSPEKSRGTKQTCERACRSSG